jgi:hypothetical protein
MKNLLRAPLGLQSDSYNEILECAICRSSFGMWDSPSSDRPRRLTTRNIEHDLEVALRGFDRLRLEHVGAVPRHPSPRSHPRDRIVSR